VTGAWARSDGRFQSPAHPERFAGVGGMPRPGRISFNVAFAPRNEGVTGVPFAQEDFTPRRRGQMPRPIESEIDQIRIRYTVRTVRGEWRDGRST